MGIVFVLPLVDLCGTDVIASESESTDSFRLESSCSFPNVVWREGVTEEAVFGGETVDGPFRPDDVVGLSLAPCGAADGGGCSAGVGNPWMTLNNR